MTKIIKLNLINKTNYTSNFNDGEPANINKRLHELYKETCILSHHNKLSNHNKFVLSIINQKWRKVDYLLKDILAFKSHYILSMINIMIR